MNTDKFTTNNRLFLAILFSLLSVVWVGSVAAGDLLAPKGIRNIPQDGLEVASKITKKGQVKTDLIFTGRNDAMNWAKKQLGDDVARIYDDTGKWIGWKNPSGDTVYWGHGDWGAGVGSSTFPHLNYIIGGEKGHLFLHDKIVNRGMLGDFLEFFK